MSDGGKMQLHVSGALLIAALALLSACNQQDKAAQPMPVQQAEDSAPRPKGAKDGSCYASDRTPIQLETVTEQVLVTPAAKDASGKVIRPASYRTETRQKVIGGGAPLLFETPCAKAMTPELIETLQRALAARGIYGGKIDGAIGPNLRQAIRKYQLRAHGLDSAILSMQAARSLGLIPYDREDL